MTNDSRSPTEIEREIEEQRSDLASNIEQLQDKLSIDTFVRQIGDQFREHGGDIGRTITDQVKANPIPLALTGIGVAWMIFGGKGQSKDRAHRDHSDPESHRDGYGALHADDDRFSDAERDFRRKRLERGLPYTPPTSYTADRNPTPSWARSDHDDDGGSIGGTMSGSADAVADKAGQVADDVKGRVSQARASVAGAASSAKDTLVRGSEAARDGAAGGAQSVREGAAALGSRIAEGTETLSAEARQRVIAARRKAIEMQHSAARSMSDGAHASADFYERQPLVVGALALAVGAAIGGALPSTKTEDDLMGDHSDNLFDEAERIFQEEKAKAMSVASSVKDEVKDIASETRADLNSGAPGDKSAVEAVGDQAKSMAKRVADKAKSSARDENLGKPKS